MEGKPDYGNWMPKRIVFLFLILTLSSFLFLVTISLIFRNLIINIILFLITVILFIIFLYLAYAFWFIGKNQGEIQKEFQNILLDHLQWDGQGKALDIGTGNGAVAIQLAKRFQEANVVGIDMWGNPWSYTKEICDRNAELEGVKNRVKFEKGNAVELPFKDAEFDAVVSSFVFHAVKIKDKKLLIREALRVLKTNGSFTFLDIFNTQFYGDINGFIKDIKNWGLKEVTFIDSSDTIHIPFILRLDHIVGKGTILFGIK